MLVTQRYAGDPPCGGVGTPTPTENFHSEETQQEKAQKYNGSGPTFCVTLFVRHSIPLSPGQELVEAVKGEGERSHDEEEIHKQRSPDQYRTLFSSLSLSLSLSRSRSLSLSLSVSFLFPFSLCFRAALLQDRERGENGVGCGAPGQQTGK
ncbi:unnamed protein product [Gadus morhua 'NCC']